MLVCQSKNTFIRTHDDFAYIVNQLTNAELIVNETGSDFLKEISRVPQDIYTIVNRLVRLYDNSVDSSVIANEFECFCRELFEEGYLLLGDTEEEIWSKDVDFSYELFNFNSEASNYGIANEQKEKDTIEFWLSQARSGIYQLNDIQLELTSSCNERCIHCYIPNETKNVGREMNFKDFCYVIDQFVEMG
ncbi:MAG: radical SAM protein, partial [Alphaproteobacteria bacterium]|nr:radical SAM protein [Alphaproteobacteria bacterium]